MKIFISGTISSKTWVHNEQIASILEGLEGMMIYLPQNSNIKESKSLFLKNLAELESSDVLLLLGDTFGVCSASEVGYMAAGNKIVIAYIEYKKSLNYLGKHLMIENFLSGLLTSNKNIIPIINRSASNLDIEALYVEKENLIFGLQELISKITKRKDSI